MPVTRIPVDVVMERVPLHNRWVSEKWQPAAVLAAGGPGVDPIEPGKPQLISDTSHGTQWRFPRCSVELHHTEAEGYYLNLSTDQPRVFVMWRMYDDGIAPPARPVVVTLSYHEAARMMDGGEQVDSVAMPSEIHAVLVPYMQEHYKPEPRKKVRRNDPLGDPKRRSRES